MKRNPDRLRRGKHAFRTSFVVSEALALGAEQLAAISSKPAEQFLHERLENVVAQALAQITKTGTEARIEELEAEIAALRGEGK